MNGVAGRPSPWTYRRVLVSTSVWPTGQRLWSEELREGGYVRGTEADCWRVTPSIAAYAVEHYSRPGAVVVDPDCGAGIVLCEALRNGRHAVGVAVDAWSWDMARANVSAAKCAGAWADGSVLDGSGTGATVRRAGVWGRADLLVTALRLRDFVGPDSDSGADLRQTARYWIGLLRPGGQAVVVLPPYRGPDGVLLDVATTVLDGAVAAGFVPVDRCIAMVAKLCGGRVLPPPAFRIPQRTSPIPTAAVTHFGVLVFRAPDLAERDDHGVLSMECGSYRGEKVA